MIKKIHDIAWRATIFSLVISTLFSGIGFFMNDDWQFHLICFVMFGTLSVAAIYVGKLIL